MSKFHDDLTEQVKENSSKHFKLGELNGALTVINRLMSENRVHQYSHNELIGAINTIGDELRGKA